jgi:hypothetical protein
VSTIDKAAYFRKIGYEPHPKQWLFHNSQARFRAPCCGRRFGKSTMAARDREPQILLPNQMGWIVGPTYDLAEKEFRVIWDDMIVKLKLGRDKRVKKGYNKKQGDMWIEFPWQHRIETRSADHPENLVGEKLHWVIMSEAAKHRQDTFQRYIRPALADVRGGADFPTTPEGFNWFHGIWAQGQDAAYPDYDSWRFPSWDNPKVYPGGRDDPEILLVEGTSLEAWFLQEYAAEFTAFVGKIYSEWQESTHVLDPTEYTFHPEWPNYIAFDWGFVNPLAAVEFQISPDDTVYVWREHYRPNIRLEEHLQILKNRPNPPGYHLDMCFGDAADPEAVATVNAKFGPCIADPLSKSNWREGVELVNGFLKARSFVDFTEATEPGEIDAVEKNAPRGLYVVRTCPNTIREFNNYRAPNTIASKSPRNPREDAQKYDDHALDALRYGLMHIFVLGCKPDQMADVYAASQSGVVNLASTVGAPASALEIVSALSTGGYELMSGRGRSELEIVDLSVSAAASGSFFNMNQEF